MAGIKETTEMVDLLLALYDVYGDAKSDGKISWDDAALLLSAMPKVGPALQGVSHIPAEIKDLDEAEAQALISHVMTHLGTTEGKAVLVVEAALKTVFSGYQLYKAIRA